MSRLFGAVVAFLLLATACPSADEAVSPPPTLLPGRVVEATPDDYREVIESWRGTPVVVNFWATWCAPCKEEMPRLVAAAERYGDRVRFLGVDVEDDADAADAFLRSMGVRYPNLGDPDGDIKDAQGVLGLPMTEFYRSDGELAFVHRGDISTEELRDRLEELLRVGVPVTPPPG